MGLDISVYKVLSKSPNANIKKKNVILQYMK